MMHTWPLVEETKQVDNPQYLTSYRSLGVLKLAQIRVLPVLFKRHLIAINILGRKFVDGFGTLPVCRLSTLQKRNETEK